MARSTPKPSRADLSTWQDYAETVTPITPPKHTKQNALPVLDTALLDAPLPPLIKRQNPELNETLIKHFFEGHSRESQKLSDPSLSSFCRNGVSPQILRQLRRMPIQSEIDLHGMTRDQAIAYLAQCLSQAHEHKHHCLQIIHGKGLHSIDGAAILKPLVRQWLSTHPQIRAFVETPDSGAVKVLLFKVTG